MTLTRIHYNYYVMNWSYDWQSYWVIIGQDNWRSWKHIKNACVNNSLNTIINVRIHRNKAKNVYKCTLPYIGSSWRASSLYWIIHHHISLSVLEIKYIIARRGLRNLPRTCKYIFPLRFGRIYQSWQLTHRGLDEYCHWMSFSWRQIVSCWLELQ